VELALKAFIRAHARKILWSHKLTKLYEGCRTLGLVIGTHCQLEIGNIVSLLESGNHYQGFRYFNIPAGARPEVAWTHEVGDALMQTVEPTIERLIRHERPGQAVVVTVTVGTPQAQGP
jgi:hypothetical protein